MAKGCPSRRTLRARWMGTCDSSALKFELFDRARSSCKSAQKDLQQNPRGEDFSASFSGLFRALVILSCAIVSTIAHGWGVGEGAHRSTGCAGSLTTEAGL